MVIFFKNLWLALFSLQKSCLLILILWTTCNALPLGDGSREAEFNDHQGLRSGFSPNSQFQAGGNLMNKRFLGYSMKSSIGRRSISDDVFGRDDRFLGYPTSQRSAGIGKRFLGAGNIKRFRLVPHIWGEEIKRIPMTNDFLGKRQYIDGGGDANLQGAIPDQWLPFRFNGGSFFYKRNGFDRNHRLQTNDFLG